VTRTHVKVINCKNAVQLALLLLNKESEDCDTSDNGIFAKCDITFDQCLISDAEKDQEKITKQKN